MAQRERLLDDWIESYVIYTYGQKSPEDYHRWVALSTIAGAIRRKVFFNMGYFLLYPNLYVILVSPPGRCAKSTAMRVGRSMLDLVPEAKFTTDSVTRERLIQDMTQCTVDGHSSMTAYSSEFGSLLTSSGMDMVVFLTDIYDSPPEWSHKTKMGGTNKIKAPYLNLMAGTTPDFIARSLPLDTVGIGLTSRIIFIYSDTPRKRKAFPTLSPEQVELMQVLTRELQTISLITGEYTLTPEAREFYEAWYEANSDYNGDQRLSGYYERKPMHLLKTGMLISASRRNETVIHKEDLEKCLGMLARAEEKMPRVFSSVGKNPLTFDMQLVEDAIRNQPGVGFAELLGRFKHNVRKEELAEVLEVLAAVGVVRSQQTKTGVIYFPLGDSSD